MRGAIVSFRAGVTSLLVCVSAVGLTGQSEQERATFRSSLDLVSVAVVVRGSDGKIVRGLRPADFEVLDSGTKQPIVQFQHGDDNSARLALLIDSSGSMVVGAKRERSRIATELLVAGFKDSDAASVFSFDSRLRRLTPFTRNPDVLTSAVTSIEPFGATGLYDAIVNTIDTVMGEAPRARALLLLTDGIDTSSVSSPGDAASAAAALDIPLYVLSVGKDLTDDRSVVSEEQTATMTLNDLATRTGGLAVEAGTIAELSIVTRTILSELRHQYVLAIPAGSLKGWHELTVRVRGGKVQARSRNGYLVS
jgi:VWFA-related protein